MINVIKDIKEYKSISMMGDLHSDFAGFQRYLEHLNVKDEAFICVGDFTRGVGFAADLDRYEKLLIKLNEYLSNNSCKLYSIRGNHDNPEYYRGAHDFSNIIFMPDNTILSINGLRFFCIGGAISIDRKELIPGIDWWPEVDMKIDESVLPEITDIDVMVTHMAPAGIPPFIFHTVVDNFALNDETLKTDLNVERHNLRQFFDKIKAQNPNLKRYYYGHYHSTQTSYIGTTKFQMLSIGYIEKVV